MAITAALAAILVFASPSACFAAQSPGPALTAPPPTDGVSTHEVELRLRDSLDSVLGGSAKERLAHIETAVWDTFRALPKNEMGRLEPRAVRHIVQGYFAREHGWVINGLEARGVQPSASEVHDADILQDRAPAFVEAMLEARRAGRGLSLSDVVAMAAALERLVVEESFSLLRAAYELNGQTVANEIDSATVHEVLSSYLLIFEYGIQADARGHHGVKQMLMDNGGSWGAAVLQFERDAVHSFDFERRHRANPFVPRKYSFGETSRMVEGLTHDCGTWQNANCRQMKNELAAMDRSGSGRVPLKAFYSKPETADHQFKESVDYLRKVGAYDEVTKSVRIVNYLMGPSNCVAKSTYYSVCCLSECEGVMNRLERKIRAPSTTPRHLAEAISNLTVKNAHLPRASALARLREIASVNGGEVPLHGRLFAEFLHFAFPMDCPFPHVAEDAAVLSPTSWTTALVTVTEEERRMHLLGSTHAFDSFVRMEPPWTAEELLPLVDPVRRAPSAWSEVAWLAAQFVTLAHCAPRSWAPRGCGAAGLGGLLRSAIVGLRTASGAGPFHAGKGGGRPRFGSTHR